MDHNHLYKSLFQAVPLPALILKADQPDFEIVDANELFYTVFTGNHDQVLNQPFFDVFPGDISDPDDIKAKVQHHSLRKVTQTGEPENLGVQKYKYLNKKSGELEWAYYQIKNSPILNEEGEAEFILHTIRDVTAEMRRKQRMERSEKRYRSLVENGYDILLILDEEGNPDYVSPNISDVLGFSVDEVMQKKPNDLVHPKDLPHVMEEINISLSNPAMPITVTPARMRHKNGSWRWMAGTITNMLHDPSIRGIVDNFRDITDQVESERKINEANEKFKTLIHTIDGIFWEADAETFIFDYVSPQAEELLGYSPEAWVGTPGFWQDKIHPDDRDQAIRYCHHETQEGRNHEFEYRFQKANGEYIWMCDVVTVAHEENQTGKLRGLMLDITEKKKLEQQLAEAYKLSNIGSWELNLEKNELTWSKFVKELHEVDPNFEPDLESAIHFYEEGDSRQKITDAVNRAIEQKSSFDVELTVITAKGNHKWIRAAGKPKVINGKVVSIYGSTQDINERKTAELANEESRLKLQNILNESMDVICVIDKDGKFEMVSPAAENVWGYRPSELEGEKYINYVISEDIKKTEKFASEIMSGESQTNFENRYRHKNGDIIPIVWAARWSDADQKMYAIARDARELKEAQKKLAETEQQLRNIVEHSTNLFYSHDVDGNLTYVSPQSYEFFGYSPEESKRHWEEFVTDHPENFKAREYTERAIKTGEAQPPYELQLKKKDGETMWVEVNEAPLVENGKTVAIVGSLTDINDRKKIQEELNTSLERYNFVTKASKDAIYDWDIVANHLHWGEGSQKLFGHHITQHKFPLEMWESMVHPSDLPDTLQSLEGVLHSEKNNWSFEYRLRRDNGQFAFVSENGYIIRDEGGEPIRMVGAIRDITDSKKQQIQNEQIQKVSQYFKTNLNLNDFIPDLLGELAREGNFKFAELWLCNADQSSLLLNSTSRHPDQPDCTFHTLSSTVTQFDRGDGLPGEIWNSKKVVLWDNVHQHPKFVRAESARESVIRSAFGLPLTSNDKFIGVLLFGSDQQASQIEQNIFRFEGLSEALGREIHRKMQEEKFFHLFESAPEILAIATPNGRFIQVNPAFCKITGYTEEELTSRPFSEFIHPEDLKNTSQEFEETISGERQANNFINRYITKSGEIVWISWYSSEVFGDDEFVFAFGRDVTEQLENEKKLRELSLVASKTTDIVIITDADKRVTWVNDAFVKLTGFTFEEIKGKNPGDMLQGPDTDPNSVRRMSRAMKHHESVEETILNYRKDGTPYWLELNIDPIFDDDGNCTHFIAIERDVTEKMEKELQLKESLERYEIVSKATSDTIWDMDLASGMVEYNKNIHNMFGYDKDQVYPAFDWWKENIHPEDHHLVNQKLRDVLAKGTERFQMEYRFRASDGSYRHVFDRAFVLKDEMGEAVRMIGAMQDITQETIEQQELKLRESVITNTNDTVVITEANPDEGKKWRKIIYVNDAFERITGYSKEEVLGKSIEILNGPETDDREVNKIRNSVENLEACEAEILNYTKDGRTFWNSFSLVPVKDRNDNYSHWVIIGRDVSDYKQNEKELKESIKEKETLLAEIHHRVKNNLAIVSSLMQMQAMNSDSDELNRQLLESVLRIKSMAGIHEQLYKANNFSKLQFSDSLKSLFNSIIETLQTDTDVTIDFDLQPIELNINQSVPCSLIMNEIITNILKHGFTGKEKGNIHLSTTLEDDLVTIRVKDDGVGLPENFNSMKSTSLGLELIEVLTKQLEGKNRYISEESGTTFELKFHRADVKGASSGLLV
ncbi:PAS domain S-box protein [Rhodohalobacter halophilus]|uniref:PAS domain S-box protein n=1 Tax=Rhodohalobacter halophilus TaxID=1812810 RepID=UPI00083F5BB7|nr:PAS domain S-box protein [Rhodohalobacter halophilus]